MRDVEIHTTRTFFFCKKWLTMMFAPHLPWDLAGIEFSRPKWGSKRPVPTVFLTGRLKLRLEAILRLDTHFKSIDSIQKTWKTICKVG